MGIGERIKTLRLKKFMTQKQLSESSNLSRSYLADIERNRYNPSLDTLISIAKSLNVSVSYLLDDGIVESEDNFESWDKIEYTELEPIMKEINELMKDLSIDEWVFILRMVRILPKKSKITDSLLNED